MQEILGASTRAIRQVLSSKYFFIFVISIGALQGLWYAISFQPSMYDEARHFGFTKMYAQHISPYIQEQDPSWDYLGETTREPSFLFYYLMSWPLRFIELITDNETVWLLGLRILCIVIFVLSLYIFRKFFYRTGVSSSVSNLALFFFVLTPGVAILPGVFSYDNLTILATALLLLTAVEIIKSKNLNMSQVTVFLALGLLGAVVKFTFIAVYAPVFIYVLLVLARRHKGVILENTTRMYKSVSRQRLILLSFVLLFSGLVFIERVGVNFIQYQSPAPSCTEVLSETRCQVNDVTRRNMENERRRSARGGDFRPIDIYNYTLQLWAPTVIRHHASPAKTIPAMKYVYLTVFIWGAFLVLLYARKLIKNSGFALMACVTLVYTLVVILYNYSAYLSQAVPVAMNGRYLFPVLPLFFVMLLASFKLLTTRIRYIYGIAFIGALLIMSQGGGITTYILDHYDEIYTKESPMYEINIKARSLLQPLVKEN